LWPALLRHASLERQVIERFNALLKRLFGCSTGWEEGMMQEDTQGWERPKCQTLVDGICGKERCGDHTAAKDGESEMEEPLTILQFSIKGKSMKTLLKQFGVGWGLSLKQYVPPCRILKRFVGIARFNTFSISAHDTSVCSTCSVVTWAHHRAVCTLGAFGDSIQVEVVGPAFASFNE
jgi:hypothetical protein